MANAHATAKPAENQPDDAAHRAHLREILDDAGTVMLVTRAAEGLHGRPMAIARVDDDGTIYLTTSIETAKVRELETDPRVDLFFQSKTRYATVSGAATVRRDRALVHELWAESWKLWFPEGKDDPNIVILVIDPERGEYWDQSGARGLSFLFRAARAYVTGKEVEPRPQDHGKVRM